MLAWARGEHVQLRARRHDAHWSDALNSAPTEWDWRDYEYRVAPKPPKPREWWLLLGARETPAKVYSIENEHYIDEACRTIGGDKVRVREVLEDR